MQNYNQIKILGKGSYGSAVLAQSTQNQKYYTIKIIDVSQLDRKQKEEALKEVHILKQLKHPFVIQYRESFIDQNRYLCIVMDYAEKGDLHSYLQSKRKKTKQYLCEEQILQLFIQICFGLKFIHDKNILHRDLKVQNLFLTQKNEIKIGDFGISKVLKNQNELAQTSIGTPYYLSPEICEEKGYNQKSDVWSLGCILYELMSFQHPFEASNMNSLYKKIIKGEYLPLPTIYSQQTRDLVAQLLQTDPEKRPTIKEILQIPIIKINIGIFLSKKQEEKRISKLMKRNQSSSNIIGNQDKQNSSNDNTNNADLKVFTKEKYQVYKTEADQSSGSSSMDSQKKIQILFNSNNSQGLSPILKTNNTNTVSQKNNSQFTDPQNKENQFFSYHLNSNEQANLQESILTEKQQNQEIKNVEEKEIPENSFKQQEINQQGKSISIYQKLENMKIQLERILGEDTLIQILKHSHEKEEKNKSNWQRYLKEDQFQYVQMINMVLQIEQALYSHK